jgi:glycosyltransferase involved in cell wall biosynthesis
MRDIWWRLSSWDPAIASVRYRAAIPAVYLARRGIASHFSAASYGVSGSARPDTMVLVKASGPRDVELAEEAVAQGMSVILDLCDNVFAPDYQAHSAGNVRRIAELASVIVTTGPALAQVLRDELGPGTPIHLVPDPLETEADVHEATRMLRRAWLGTAYRQPYSRLPRAVTGIVSSAVRSAARRLSRPTTSSLRRVLWFGNPGSIRPRFGLVNLLDVSAELERAARDEPFRLVVVTSNRAAYRRHIEPLALETEFVRWDGLGIFRQLRDASVMIAPNSRDAFSICKSSNRAVLALGHGVPVVATRIPSLEVLADAMLFDDFHSGVVSYLRDRALASRHLGLAAEIIETEFSGDVIAAGWIRAFDAASAAARISARAAT